MFILRIEHAVSDFASWKRTFDSDPAGRQTAGVRHFRVLRPVDDAQFATVDLEFAERQEAEAMLQRLQRLWGRIEGSLITGPRSRLFEVIERADL
jgi:hypothetical protein